MSLPPAAAARRVSRSASEILEGTSSPTPLAAPPSGPAPRARPSDPEAASVMSLAAGTGPAAEGAAAVISPAAAAAPQSALVTLKKERCASSTAFAARRTRAAKPCCVWSSAFDLWSFMAFARHLRGQRKFLEHYLGVKGQVCLGHSGTRIYLKQPFGVTTFQDTDDIKL